MPGIKGGLQLDVAPWGTASSAAELAGTGRSGHPPVARGRMARATNHHAERTSHGTGSPYILETAALTAGYAGLSSLDARSFAADAGRQRPRAGRRWSASPTGSGAPCCRRSSSTTRPLNFDIVAVCDIWSRRRDEGKAALEKAIGPPDRDVPQHRGALRDGQGRRRRHHQHGRLPARPPHRRGGEGRQGLLHRETAGRDDGGQPRRAEGRPREQADRANRIAAPQRPRTTSPPRSSSSRASSARSCTSTSSGT